MDPDSAIARQMKDTIRQSEAIRNAWVDAVSDSVVNFRMQDGQKKNAQEGVKKSIRSGFSEDKYFARQMDKWSELDSKKVRVGKVEKNSALYDVGIPDTNIYFDVSKIRTEMDKHGDHLSSDTLKGIPSILNDPIVICEYTGPKGDIKNTVSVYGDLFYNGHPVVVGIVMRKDRSGENIISNIRTIHARSNFAKGITDDTVLYLNEDKKRTRNWFQVCGISNVPLEGTRFGLIRSIQYSDRDVNSYALNSSRTNQDSAYLELAKDPEKNKNRLAKMVEKAAKDAGYTKLFYHGSKKGGGFTMFRDWQYFTENKEYAKRYTERGKEKSLYTTYVKMENPFDTRIPEVRGLFEQARMEYGMGALQENGLPDWTDGYDIADFIDENDLPYDSIILDEGGDMVNGEPVSRGLSYVIRKSNQVKLADAVTYDDSGEIIPLSQRFDAGQKDIRYSSRTRQDSQIDRLTAQNEKLQQEADYLRQLVQIQKSGNKDFILDRNSVKKQAGKLMASANANGDTGEFSRMLNDFYHRMHTDSEITWDAMQEDAGAIADWLLEHHEAQRDEYAQSVLDFLKKRRVRLSENQVGDIEYSYGSLSDFKPAIKGSIILDQSANTSLDQLWQEAAAQFPDRFSTTTNEADMPDGLAEVVKWANSSKEEKKETHPTILKVGCVSLAERVGFEPTVRCRITSFQDWLLKPLGHLSIGIHDSILYLESQG